MSSLPDAHAYRLPRPLRRRRSPHWRAQDKPLCRPGPPADHAHEVVERRTPHRRPRRVRSRPRKGRYGVVDSSHVGLLQHPSDDLAILTAHPSEEVVEGVLVGHLRDGGVLVPDARSDPFGSNLALTLLGLTDETVDHLSVPFVWHDDRLPGRAVVRSRASRAKVPIPEPDASASQSPMGLCSDGVRQYRSPCKISQGVTHGIRTAAVRNGPGYGAHSSWTVRSPLGK